MDYQYFNFSAYTVLHTYNTTQLCRKFRSVLTRLGGADAVVLQNNCVRRTSPTSYVAGRLRFEPATFLTRGTEPTTEPPRSTYILTYLHNRSHNHYQVFL